jgi:hypothetical protein
MRNPAERLHEIFSTWSASYGPNVTAFSARGLDTKGDAAYATQLEAFRLLVAIDQALIYLAQRGIDVLIYRAEWKNWIDMALHIPNSWANGSDPNTGFPATPMAHLKTLAILLNVDRPGLSEKPEETLRAVLAEVFRLLAVDENLSDSLRAYIFGLASEMRNALDDEAVVGTFDFAGAAERLWVSLQAAAGQSKSHRTDWKRASTSMFRDAGAAAIGSMPTLALTVMQMIQTGT